MPFQRILIEVDDEPVAAHAADVGLELAGNLYAEIAFIHVIDSQSATLPDTGVSAPERASLLESDAKRLLGAFQKRVPPEASALEFIQMGRPATEIVKTARQWSADFIVIGTHGRCGMQRAFLGSVAEQVIRNAPCPVMAIRAIC